MKRGIGLRHLELAYAKAKGAAPRTTEQMQRDYLTQLVRAPEAPSRARALAAVTAAEVRSWQNTDKDFLQLEAMIVAKDQDELAERARAVIMADTEEGLPRYPAHVMAAAKIRLEEYQPKTQHVKHEHTGAIAVGHMKILEQIPDDMLDRFIETGESDIEMDRIAEEIWAKK